MSVIEDVPVDLVNSNKQTEFIVWLIALPISSLRKKQILIEWCKFVGVPLTRDLVRSAGIM